MQYIDDIIKQCNDDMIFKHNNDFYVNRLSDIIHNDIDEKKDFIIKTNKIPLLYFFDKYLNSKVNITIEHRDLFFGSINNVYDVSNLNKKYIINIGIDNHAVILYPFTFNMRNYVYLSNSGLGINNQNTDIDRTSCKICHIVGIGNIDKIYKLLTLINEIITIITNTTSVEYLFDQQFSLAHKKTLHENINSVWSNIKQQFVNTLDENIINEIFLTKFFKNIQHNLDNSSEEIGYIHLIYLLLNYFAQVGVMNECTFHHVLLDSDHPRFIELIRGLIYNGDIRFTFDELYQNCINNYNSDVYKLIRNEIDISQAPIQNNFINSINDKLNECALLKSTINFKRDSICLELRNSGLYNYIQVGGSCVFYCFYNLFINHLFLNNTVLYRHQPIKAVDNVIFPIIYMHYSLLRCLCMSNDTDYLFDNGNFYPNYIFHMNYIYNIILQNNLIDEISEFYRSSRLLFVTKTPLIDKLLEFPIDNSSFIPKDEIKVLPYAEINRLKQYFNEIDLLFNSYLHNLRNTPESVTSASLRSLHKNLYRNYDQINGLFIAHGSGDEDCLLYINITRDIILIYCFYLYNIYKKRTTFRNYLKKPKSKINILLPVYSYPSYIKLDKCGAYSDCLKHKCSPQIYQIFIPYNFDYILNKFSINEMYYISYLININYEKDIQDAIPKLFKLDMCNNIYIHSINVNQFNLYNNNINIEIDDPSIILKRLISKYFRNKYLSINTLIHISEKMKHENKCKYISEKIKEQILSNINTTSLTTFKSTLHAFLKDIKYIIFIKILLFIVSNGLYIMLSNYDCNNSMFYNILTLINDETIIFYDTEDDFILEKFYKILMNNDKLDILDNNIVKHIDWISKYNIVYSIGYFEYNNDRYVYNLKAKYRSPISFILARFGLHEHNSDEYILLMPYTQVHDDVLISQFDDEGSLFLLFICIKKTKIIIEINIIDSLVDTNNCYLLKNQQRYKLEFNIEYPFLSFFTETTPYLCYKDNNKTYVDIIVSNVFWALNNINNYEFLFYKEPVDKNTYYEKFQILEFEISYAMIFPKINTNNIEFIYKIHQYYPSNNILQFSTEQLILQDFTIDNTNIDKITSIINGIATILCKNINCDERTNEIFKTVFTEELQKSESRIAILESFLKENRLCIRFDFNQEILSAKTNIISELNSIIDQLIIQYNYNKCQFIIDNMQYIITIMEINLLINELYKINTQTTCWDIQLLLTKLDTILYFNKEIKEKKYHLYELLYLFQNNYFYKESQLIKYRNILVDIKEDNSSLSIHQFMMGKGKTSLLTPLLSMAIYLFTGKSSVVITTEHLVSQTINYMQYIHYLGNIPYDIVTDYEYKHFWLEKTDINLLSDPKVKCNHKMNIDDISKTSLIIDEFNSHYDYTQSMFNLVKNQEVISEEMFNYIFDYIHSKILQTPFVDTEIPELQKLQKYDLFKSILDNQYDLALKLKYNEKYGFPNIVGGIRLCIPYARKDTPLQESRFSSILFTIILTINYYINIQKYKLDEKYDYPLMIKNYIHILKFLPAELFYEWYEYIQQNTKLDVDFIHTSVQKLYSNMPIYIQLLKKFLYIVNKPALVYATEQYNVSFQDIIYNVYEKQWKVGYTGTIYLNPNIYLDSDTFVFKNIIEDFDELIEVKLALQGYGSPREWNNNVIIINTNTQNIVIEQLQTILSTGINRGIVDIAGLFIDYTNKYIAKELKTLLADKKIVYLSDTHIGLEYSENDNDKYIPFDNNNFYYYDQCHIVGTDLEQPNEGYVAVIIDNLTKWTDFSQGIFRFRKLNRGTYLKVFYITNNTDPLETSLTNVDILELLEQNEIKFQENQQLGITFQLLKTMVRRISRNYLEDKLLIDFLLSKPVSRDDCIEFFQNNIKDIQSVLANHDNPYLTKIYTLYNTIIDNENVIDIVTGNQSTEKQIDMEILQNIDINIQKLSVSHIKYNNTTTHLFDIITHLKCSQCINTTCVPLFLNDYNCYINGKPIFISINIYNGFSIEHIDTTLLIYVELPDIIILEIEYIAYDYYLHKVPIYDFNGNLINTFIKNNNSPHPFTLDIDYRFIYLFRVQKYINPIIEKNKDILTPSIIEEIENNLNIEAVKIIYFLNQKLPNYYKNYFLITPIIQYLNKIYKPDDVIQLIPISIKDNNQEHNPDYRLDNIFFNRFSNINGIILDNEYFPTIQPFPFQIIYDKYYIRLDFTVT